jgi:Fe-S-cluster containining protein
MVNAFSFACSACGKCCNSPPAMTLAELFRHRERFIGCIAIGRVPRRRTGERLRVGHRESVLDEADIAAFDAMANTLLHRAGDTFSITAQGYDYPSLARCPALEDDGRCAIHLHGKPLTCEVVPLDPLVPDTLQHLVLAGRNQSAVYLGADCIHEGTREGAALLVAQGQVVEANANDALKRRRVALEKEREVWGRAVFQALRKELFDSPAALARIPDGGFLTISLVPALLVVAAASANSRRLCVDYIDSQLALIDRCIAQALLRRRLDDRPVTQELRGFANAYRHAKAVLIAPASDTASDSGRPPSPPCAVEAYLSGGVC